MLKPMRLILSSLLIHKIKLLSLVLFLTTATEVASAFSNKTDRLALLSFKELIAEDPLGSLSSWNNSLELCEWDGVTCSRKHQRVVVLDLRGKSLRGILSPFLGNLSFLRSLYLQENRFQGKIPLELDHLFRLQHLNLSFNSLQGEIPTNLSNYLTTIDFKSNNLVGKIPASFGSLSKLTYLNLKINNLIGGIPPSLGNLSLLQIVNLGFNNITGTIPHSIGRLPNLKQIVIGPTKLSGTVPPSLYNSSTLTHLVISYNQLTGVLPQNIGLTLPNLQVISVGRNQFWGPFPVSLSNASRLRILDLALSNLSGPVPFDLGRIMKDLGWLILGGNYLGSGDASDLRFIDSLTNCSKLQALVFYGNGFGGVLPTTIANLSSQLNKLSGGVNQLVGTIPAEISNLVNLAALLLDNNHFKGVIPFEIGKLRNLQQLDLLRNKLSGPIPSSICNLTKMYQLSLEENNLNSSLPSCIENIPGLQILNLSYNILAGPIPETIGLSSSLTFLNLAHNSFMGALPLEIGKLNNLQELDVSDNKLSGDIPSTLGNCLRLESLCLEGNMFQGSIPHSFSSLRGIEILDLSRNNLSGQIEEYLAALIFLKNLNLSFNNLAGEVPSHGVFGNLSAISLVGNNGLCGGSAEMQLPACPKSVKKGNRLGFKVIVAIACMIPCLSFVLLLVVFLGKRKQKTKFVTQPFIGDDFLRVSYDQLSKATNGFSSTNLIGAGSFGTVFKGFLHEGEKPVAVKVLNLDQGGASKSFIAECEALRKTRHRNLLRIITTCSSVDHAGQDFKAIVFEYMPNGSLENWLHPGEDAQLQAVNLELNQRLDIAIDIMCALDYLHHSCEKPIVHCDLKPNNVLIDEDMTAHVGDFGLARFLTVDSNYIGGEESNSLAIKGSIGYVAPEYGVGGKISTQGDVYSYGILLLEMMTGRRPTDEIFTDRQSLHEFCKLALPERVMGTADSQMLFEEPKEARNDVDQNEKIRQAKVRECLMSLMRIGVACSAKSPSQRMNVKDALVGLMTIKEVFLGVGIHGKRHSCEETSRARY
ncbi:probable LRR receptor-like serine/threonine-protein kinase At3g47570 isoform X2 [Rhododendron vialii]|uniref:probable LRR receptor-like serine/threonine-protein kinase At3g47570 isoform X2 n=1 Tax=Rhododendron vialii TaxID=182163 RepID=UPI00265D953F|nr:probable LRR receptor-like serine/threonine-protein kinase At3g47570 isoform X2 [Rhododendron vialii]